MKKFGLHQILKRFFVIIYLILLTSCISSQRVYKPLINNNDAGAELQKRLAFAQEQFQRSRKEKKVDFSLIKDFVLLSGIKCKTIGGHWSETVYIPNEDNLINWNTWLEINRGKFYFNKKHRVVKFLNSRSPNEREIIFIKTKDGKVKSSLSNEDLLLSYYAIYHRSDLKESTNASDKILTSIISLIEDDGFINKTLALNSLSQLSKIKLSITNIDVQKLTSWFNGYEDYIFYEGNKIAIKYPNGEKIVLNESI